MSVLIAVTGFSYLGQQPGLWPDCRSRLWIQNHLFLEKHSPGNETVSSVSTCICTYIHIRYLSSASHSSFYVNWRWTSSMMSGPSGRSDHVCILSFNWGQMITDNHYWSWTLAQFVEAWWRKRLVLPTYLSHARNYGVLHQICFLFCCCRLNR